ncbi:MAG: hypothetical protein EZS28_014283 [Streblomastix strix]|uniref:Right handed beta helix domain-containing protein n=1 Tax=Streblomastix strix TaxID=222440 RepID=A0A5J4W688_9EUKA|nr:MAG: hypothetical protein EZS28_014283 [Streblomastix strix]
MLFRLAFVLTILQCNAFEVPNADTVIVQSQGGTGETPCGTPSQPCNSLYAAFASIGLDVNNPTRVDLKDQSIVEAALNLGYKNVIIEPQTLTKISGRSDLGRPLLTVTSYSVFQARQLDFTHFAATENQPLIFLNSSSTITLNNCSFSPQSLLKDRHQLQPFISVQSGDLALNDVHFSSIVFESCGAISSQVSGFFNKLNIIRCVFTHVTRISGQGSAIDAKMGSNDVNIFESQFIGDVDDTPEQEGELQCLWNSAQVHIQTGNLSVVGSSFRYLKEGALSLDTTQATITSSSSFTQNSPLLPSYSSFRRSIIIYRRGIRIV